jgi:hypothetical protein
VLHMQGRQQHGVVGALVAVLLAVQARPATSGAACDGKRLCAWRCGVDDVVARTVRQVASAPPGVAALSQGRQGAAVRGRGCTGRFFLHHRRRGSDCQSLSEAAAVTPTPPRFSTARTLR